ncbi:ABC transporter permease [Aestuariivirga litoralis]|uniref:ABC transporter permease n=1 Tax=Aestuariivirga litoralis TaxID=2650924 RepID=UPI0018C7BA31|nr:ABC transporter permease [Aestuariivirga litoralis]MBG1232903.1 ABC transporter permease [Aestuariivirga litoralis]
MKGFFKTWEGLLLVILIATMAANALIVPEFLTVQNQINLFTLSIEKAIVALIMTYVIISAEIDLSVASVMGLAACVFGSLISGGWNPVMAIAICLAVGAAAGAFNAFWITYVGIPSLVATLAMLIGFRGFARVLLEDRGINGFPDWFNGLARDPLVGPLPFSIVLFIVLLVILGYVLHFTSFGRKVFVIGNNAEMARYSGVRTARVKTAIYVMSGVIAAAAGLLYAARLSSVRGDAAYGFELDIITMVLLGGVSIFGGRGSMLGVVLSILIVLNLRNGMSLMNIDGHRQTAVIGVLLICSVLVPNLMEHVRVFFSRPTQAPAKAAGSGAAPTRVE